MTAAPRIAVHRFRPDDLDALRVQRAQAVDVVAQDRQARVRAAELGPSFTALADGRVLMCAGMIENHPGAATAWALLAEGIGPLHLELTRATVRVIEATRYARVDMVVRTGFPAAHRWARALGFAREATLAAWGPGGWDADVYARVRRG